MSKVVLRNEVIDLSEEKDSYEFEDIEKYEFFKYKGSVYMKLDKCTAHCFDEPFEDVYFAQGISVIKYDGDIYLDDLKFKKYK